LTAPVSSNLGSAETSSYSESAEAQLNVRVTSNNRALRLIQEGKL